MIVTPGNIIEHRWSATPRWSDVDGWAVEEIEVLANHRAGDLPIAHRRRGLRRAALLVVTVASKVIISSDAYRVCSRYWHERRRRRSGTSQGKVKDSSKIELQFFYQPTITDETVKIMFMYFWLAKEWAIYTGTHKGRFGNGQGTVSMSNVNSKYKE